MQTIKGLKNFYQYFYNGVNYYLLGDIHLKLSDPCPDYQCDHMINNFKTLKTQSTTCVNITAFIYEWLNYNYNRNISTNFYIENAFSKESTISNQLLINYEDNDGNTSYSNKGYMFDTLIMLKDCLHHQCQYNPIVKIHYVDPRQTVVKGIRYHSNPFILDDFLNYFTVAKDYLSTIDINTQLNEYVKLIYFLINQSPYLLHSALSYSDYTLNINEFLKELGKILPEKSVIRKKFRSIIVKMLELTKNRELNEIVNLHPIAAQFLHLDDLMVKKIRQYITFKNNQDIKKLLEPQINLNTFEYNEFSIQYDVDNIHDDMLNSISNINNKLVLLSSVYMDAYILSRMFKYEQEEVIIYVGSNHIPVISKFLKHLKAEVVIEIDNPNTCIHISSENINKIRNEYK